MVIGPFDAEVGGSRERDRGQASVGATVGSGKEDCVDENPVLMVQVRGKPQSLNYLIGYTGPRLELKISTLGWPNPNLLLSPSRARTLCCHLSSPATIIYSYIYQVARLLRDSLTGLV